jgi:hypothetical protein
MDFVPAIDRNSATTYWQSGVSGLRLPRSHSGCGGTSVVTVPSRPRGRLCTVRLISDSPTSIWPKAMGLRIPGRGELRADTDS